MPDADKGPRRHNFRMPSSGVVIPVYAGQKIGKALEEVEEDLDLYKGVRLAEIIEAVYKQGLKDGRGERNPGAPSSRSSLRILSERLVKPHCYA